MPTSLPSSHVADALKLEGDAYVDLFELSPLSGGSFHFKNDNDVTWLGTLYEGLPVSMTGEEEDLTKLPQPQLTIGQDDLDLLPFKGLIFDGHLEGGSVVRYRFLLTNLLANLNIKQTTRYRIKQVGEYSRTKISLNLSSFSSATNQTVPFRQYIPPYFPYVSL
jgi:phage-related protein